ncbi:MAG TPA: hypothetical protein VMC79_02740 [Rectinemataceae bacterium]|nr:hypothetical protein [Rectinemataceae bacterium]
MGATLRSRGRRADIGRRCLCRPGAASILALLGAILLLSGLGLTAQSAATPAATGAAAGAASGTASGDDESMFGAETVTQSQAPATGSPDKDFLKYDQVKVGGQIKGSVGWSPVWSPAWDGSASLFSPTSDLMNPDLEGKLTITAKPLTDFGVNAEFRTQWPFTTSHTDSNGTAFTVPNISVWSFYSKFNWQDKAYFSFGKQPLSWGVSKGAFQPADDVFAVSSAIDLTNTSAEREGPISLRMTVPLTNTDNFYFLGGIPTPSNGSTAIDPKDARVGVKAELGTGNTELGAAAFYSYNDHPRALLMGTTGNGDFNFFGEAILKYGSERDFITAYNNLAPPLSTVATYDSRFFFSGTGGGYYMNADNHITLLAQYYYNGEGQTKLSAEEAYAYYVSDPGAIDRIRLGTHYGFVSLSWGQFLQEDLTATVYAISNLSDGSGMVSPSLSWQLFDYLAISIGATFTFGAPGTEYILYGPVVNGSSGSGADKPAAALNLTLTASTEAF